MLQIRSYLVFDNAVAHEELNLIVRYAASKYTVLCISVIETIAHKQGLYTGIYS